MWYDARSLALLLDFTNLSGTVKVTALSQTGHASAGDMHSYDVHVAHMCGSTSVDTKETPSGLFLPWHHLIIFMELKQWETGVHNRHNPNQWLITMVGRSITVLNSKIWGTVRFDGLAVQRTEIHFSSSSLPSLERGDCSQLGAKGGYESRLVIAVEAITTLEFGNLGRTCHYS